MPKIFSKVSIFYISLCIKFIFVVLPSIVARKIGEIEQVLVKNKSLINGFIYGSHKRTLLHKAAQIGDSEICQLLVDHGAEVNKQDTWKQTPLWLAAKEGHGNLCNMLIQKGAFVDAEDAAERTPLWIASSRKHEEVCKILIQNGADVFEKGNFALFCYELFYSDYIYMCQLYKYWYFGYKTFKHFAPFFNLIFSWIDEVTARILSLSFGYYNTANAVLIHSKSSRLLFLTFQQQTRC